MDRHRPRPRARGRGASREDAPASRRAKLLLDYPAKTQMLSLDLPVLMRDETVVRLTAAGMAGAIDLPVLSDKLYKSARWLRVFTASRVVLSEKQVFLALEARA